MTYRNFATVRAKLAASLLTVLLTACATTAPVSPEAAVKARATARWQALVAGNYKDAYGLITPSYRAVTPLDKYRASFGGAVAWTGAEVVGVTCEAEKCTARVRVDASPADPRFGKTLSTHVDETWLLDDGQWWLFQKL